MKISITFVAVVLALAAVATSCAMFAGQSARGGGVYLVGVAGGG